MHCSTSRSKCIWIQKASAKEMQNWSEKIEVTTIQWKKREKEIAHGSESEIRHNLFLNCLIEIPPNVHCFRIHLFLRLVEEKYKNPCNEIICKQFALFIRLYRINRNEACGEWLFFTQVKIQVFGFWKIKSDLWLCYLIEYFGLCELIKWDFTICSLVILFILI